MQIVNPVPVEQVAGWLESVATSLLGSPWDEFFPRRVSARSRRWIPERVWGVQDHGRWVATLATDPLTLTIPGTHGSTRDLPADGLTGVGVAATHRRRGLLTAMITQSLQQAVDRGDPVSILIAAEWPIYGRFGYAPAARWANYTFHTRWAGAVIDPDPRGTLRQVTTAELFEHAGAIYERDRRRFAGQIDRPGDWWARRLEQDGYEALGDWKGTWILHETDGEPDGFLCWKATRDFDLDGHLGAAHVLELVTGSDVAYRNLWGYLAALDVVEEIRLDGRPLDEPVRWLLEDGRCLEQRFLGDGTWLRILDVPAALSARGYATAGRIVIEVVDPAPGGYASGRYLLDTDGKHASCTPTTESAQLRLPQYALAAAYLGDHSVRALSVAGGVDELEAGAIGRLDTLLATPLHPWNATGF